MTVMFYHLEMCTSRLNFMINGMNVSTAPSFALLNFIHHFYAYSCGAQYNYTYAKLFDRFQVK